MTDLPNPFQSAAPQLAEQAAASVHITPVLDAAAEPIDEHRFVLDEERFLAAIEPLPLFLQAPIDVMSVLAAY